MFFTLLFILEKNYAKKIECAKKALILFSSKVHTMSLKRRKTFEQILRKFLIYMDEPIRTPFHPKMAFQNALQYVSTLPKRKYPVCYLF